MIYCSILESRAEAQLFLEAQTGKASTAGLSKVGHSHGTGTDSVLSKNQVGSPESKEKELCRECSLASHKAPRRSGPHSSNLSVYFRSPESGLQTRSKIILLEYSLGDVCRSGDTVTERRYVIL
jgi:hypothetical protein